MFRTCVSANPVLAMHSVRETASVDDHIYCVGAFTQFYNLILFLSLSACRQT